MSNWNGDAPLVPAPYVPGPPIMDAPSDEIALLIAEVGETPTLLLQANANRVWTQYQAQGAVDPRLLRLYTKRTFIDIALAFVRIQVDSTTGARTVKRDQETAHLRAMRTEVTAEIVRVEGGGGAATGMITAITPITPYLVNQPDEIDPILVGSPYVRAYLALP